MAPKRLRLQTGTPGGSLQNPAHAVLVESSAGKFAMTSDPAKGIMLDWNADYDDSA
jgi:hypothetical protein